MKKTLGYSAVLFFCIGLGVYAWKIANTGYNEFLWNDSVVKRRFSKNSLLVVGEESIEQADIDFEIGILTKNLKLSKTFSSSATEKEDEKKFVEPLREKVLESLVERKLLYQYLTKEKDFARVKKDLETQCKREYQDFVVKHPEDFQEQGARQKLKQRVCEMSIVKNYLEKEVYQHITISEDDAKEFYKKHIEQFRAPNATYIRQIVFADEKTARRTAPLLSKQNFVAMAKQYSIAPEAEFGGYLGPIYAGSGMPRFYDVVYPMKKGQISNILKSTYGFHIILIIEKEKEHILSYSEARIKLIEKLKQIEEEKAFKKWVQLSLDSIPLNHPPRAW